MLPLADEYFMELLYDLDDVHMTGARAFMDALRTPFAQSQTNVHEERHSMCIENCCWLSPACAHTQKQTTKSLTWCFVHIPATSTSLLNKFAALWPSSRNPLLGYVCTRIQFVDMFSFACSTSFIDSWLRLGGCRCYVSPTGDRSREFFEENYVGASNNWQRRHSHGIWR